VSLDQSPPGWEAIEGSIRNVETLNAGRKKVALGAMKCFLENGFSNTSVYDIAEAAEVSIGSVYKYVRAKEDVLWLIAEMGIESTNQVMTESFGAATDPHTRLVDAVATFVQQGHRDRRLMQLLYVEFRHLPEESQRRIREQEESIIAGFTAVIEAGHDAGVFNCPDPRMAAINISMFTSTWALKHSLFGKMTVDDYIAAQQQAALRQVGAVNPSALSNGKPAR